jgi:hypothetical protein
MSGKTPPSLTRGKHVPGSTVLHRERSLRATNDLRPWPGSGREPLSRRGVRVRLLQPRHGHGQPDSPRAPPTTASSCGRSNPRAVSAVAWPPEPGLRFEVAWPVDEGFGIQVSHSWLRRWGQALRRSHRGHDVQPSIAVHIGAFQDPAALVASVRKLQELALDNRGTSFRRSTPYHVNTSRPPLALAPTAAPDEVVGAHASAMPSRNSDAGPIARAEECASG